jgi:hypothetical protein
MFVCACVSVSSCSWTFLETLHHICPCRGSASTHRLMILLSFPCEMRRMTYVHIPNYDVQACNSARFCIQVYAIGSSNSSFCDTLRQCQCEFSRYSTKVSVCEERARHLVLLQLKLVEPGPGITHVRLHSDGAIEPVASLWNGGGGGGGCMCVHVCADMCVQACLCAYVS